MTGKLTFKFGSIKDAISCNAREIVRRMISMDAEVEYVTYSDGKIEFSKTPVDTAVGMIERLDLTDLDGVSRCNACGLLEAGWIEEDHRCFDTAQEEKLKGILVDAIAEEIRMGGMHIWILPMRK